VSQCGGMGDHVVRERSEHGSGLVEMCARILAMKGTRPMLLVLWSELRFRSPRIVKYRQFHYSKPTR
jgi:hypothetical protein